MRIYQVSEIPVTIEDFYRDSVKSTQEQDINRLSSDFAFVKITDLYDLSLTTKHRSICDKM
jgi:hypothetical protein